MWWQAESNSPLCYQACAALAEVLPLKRCHRMSRLCGATQTIICRWVKINTEAVLTTLPRLAASLPLRCGDLSVTLLCVSGLESLPDSRRCALLVAHFTHPYRMAALVLSRCCPGSTTLSSLLHGLSDCLPRYFLHLCYIGAYALRNSLPLAVWLRCRFIQAAIALFFIPSSVALLLMLAVGFRCVFCF